MFGLPELIERSPAVYKYMMTVFRKGEGAGKSDPPGGTGHEDIFLFFVHMISLHSYSIAQAQFRRNMKNEISRRLFIVLANSMC